MIDRKRTACFTGHRNIPTHHRQQLTELLDRMIEALYRKGVVSTVQAVRMALIWRLKRLCFEREIGIRTSG